MAIIVMFSPNTEEAEEAAGEELISGPRKFCHPHQLRKLPGKNSSVVQGIGCTVMISVTIVIPVFMIIVGSLKMDECPAEPYIPIYLVVGGTFGVLKNLLGFQGRLRRPLAEEEGGDSSDASTPWHRRLKFTGSINFFLSVWFILGCVWVYRIYEPSYTPSDRLYCDYSLYQFAFWLVTSVYIAVGLLTSCMCCLSVATVVMKHNHMTEVQV
nr:transmembrane protein 272-like [Cherax quadricarinatus]